VRCVTARLGELHELGVDAVGRRLPARVEEVDELGAHEHVLLERHGPRLGDDDVGVAPHGLQPVAELLGVRHRRAQRDQAHVLGQVDDHFLPHRPAEPVGQVVHLVHDDIREVAQQVAVGVEHVAQHLGGHDHDARARVDVRVAGEQADLAVPVLGDELVVLLVAEGLHGRGVEDLRRRLEHGQEHRELGHDRLAGTGGRRHQHAATLLERRAGRLLERVELDAQRVAEGPEAGQPLQRALRGVAAHGLGR